MGGCGGTVAGSAVANQPLVRSIWPQTQEGEVESEEQESKRALRDEETCGPELRFHQLQVSLFFTAGVLCLGHVWVGCTARTASISCVRVFGCGYLSRKCSVFFAVW